MGSKYSEVKEAKCKQSIRKSDTCRQQCMLTLYAVKRITIDLFIA